MTTIFHYSNCGLVQCPIEILGDWITFNFSLHVMILITENFYCEITTYCGHNLIWLTVVWDNPV